MKSILKIKDNYLMTQIYFRADGSFVVSNVPSGSYIVEVTNPVYAFEPVRVDINSKGLI